MVFFAMRFARSPFSLRYSVFSLSNFSCSFFTSSKISFFFCSPLKCDRAQTILKGLNSKVVLADLTDQEIGELKTGNFAYFLNDVDETHLWSVCVGLSKIDGDAKAMDDKFVSAYRYLKDQSNFVWKP